MSISIPPTLIALETSGACCSVAVLRARADQAGGDVLVHTRAQSGTASHAERLLPMLDELLQEAGVARESVHAVAFGQGPGGFTGLRVAAGVTQGLALALDIPVLPVVSHRAVASQVMRRAGEQTGEQTDEIVADAIVVVALDARMGEVYVAAYMNDDCELQAPVLLPAGALAAWSAAQLPRWSQAAGQTLTCVIAAGDGWDVAGVALPSGWRRDALARHPDAASVARVAWRDWCAGRAQPAQAALPLYVRDKVAYTTAERALGAGGNPRAGDPVFPQTQNALIAPMTANDLTEVVALEASVQTHPWTHGNFADALAAGYAAWVLRDAASSHVKGRLLGFAVVMLAPDIAHILTIAVARDMQRQGLARRLLQHAEAFVRAQNVSAQHMPGLLLEVRVSNAAARAFYQRAGFESIGVRRGYYPAASGNGREDALVLQKMLPACPERTA